MAQTLPLSSKIQQEILFESMKAFLIQGQREGGQVIELSFLLVSRTLSNRIISIAQKLNPIAQNLN